MATLHIVHMNNLMYVAKLILFTNQINVTVNIVVIVVSTTGDFKF